MLDFKFNRDKFLHPDQKPQNNLDPLNYLNKFKSSANFAKLIGHIKTIASKKNTSEGIFAQSILERLQDAPELFEEIYDVSILNKHQKLIDSMMIFVFPESFYEKQLYAAASSFMTNLIFASPLFKETIKITPEIGLEGELDLDEYTFNWGRVITLFTTILNFFYGQNINFEVPLIYKSINPLNGLDRYFKLNIANEFMEIKLKGELPKLSKEDIQNIRMNIYDFEYLTKILSPDLFLFSGFLVINAINVTETEIVSTIKKELIQKNTITSYPSFLRLQHNVKCLLKCPNLLLGITDYPGSKNFFRYGRKFGNSFIMNHHCSNVGFIEDSIYQYCIDKRRPIVIEDLTSMSGKTKIEEGILKQGIRSILVAPLLNDDNVVGILEIGAPEPGMLNNINTIKLRNVIPLFAMAIERSSEEFNNKIEAVIKEKCTAIHPSLEWKFRNAALNLLKKEEEGIKAEMEEIVFDNVYPLYGMSDIRNSSSQRNEAIRKDLIENLNSAKHVLTIAQKYKPMYALEDFIYRIDKKIYSLAFGINSSDEAQILGFMKNQVASLFVYLQTLNEIVNVEVKKYFSNLDAKLGFVYKERKAYEDSAQTINETIAAYIDEEQEKIQEIYPHYFERYKTDGVEHTIYIGESLNEERRFNELYLRNIRLWQLIIMCNAAVLSQKLKARLSMKLDTAHLVLVQSTPMSVRFRLDEKKFDVDGAYNVRYEIMKKRIDKAEIKGKEERLTQPGKIAIVYSQNSEYQEYIEYVEYLQSKNYLKMGIEELELEELQGVKGLKAIRVSVNNENFNFEKLDTLKLFGEVKNFVKS